MRAVHARKHLALRAAAVTCLLLAAVLPSAIASGGASASTIAQSNGCLGVTGAFSTFAIPISSTAPASVGLGGSVTLSSTSVAVSVDATLIGAGVTTGLVQAADSLADIGAFDNTHTANPNAGVNNVSAAVGSVKLTITASNTTEGNQTASNTGVVNTSFYVTADAAGANVKVYTSISIPPSTTPNPARTGTLLTGALNVTIPLADTTWTPAATGTINFSEKAATPSSLTTPTLADKLAAPLQIKPKINGAINVPFICWGGSANAAGTALVPGPSQTIASVTVTAGGGTTTTTAGGGTTTTTAATTTTTAATTTTTAPPPTTTAAPTTTTLPPPTVHSGKASYVTDCTNSLQKGSVSNLDFSITATAPTSVDAGKAFVLSNQKWTVTTPGSLIDLGLNAGLLNPGDTIIGSVTAVINATHTAQGSVASPAVPVKVGPIVVDPVTGNAKNLTSSFAVPDMTFVSGGGTVAYSMGTTTFKLAIGAVKVTFTCTPQKATVIVTTTVIGTATVTTTPTTVSTAAQGGETSTTVHGASTTTAPLPFTGSSSALVLLAIAFILIDIGFLAIGATRNARRRLYRSGH